MDNRQGKGIIFSAAMVRGLIREAESPGTGKTNTRRLLSLRGYRGFSEFGPSDTEGYDWHFRRADGCWCDFTGTELRELLPYAPGDRLYVREGWACHWSTDTLAPRDIHPEMWSVRYLADDHIRPATRDGSTALLEQCRRGRPSIFMPRWASRLWLDVTDVRVQRVAEITPEDARAEGVEGTKSDHYKCYLDPLQRWSSPRCSFRTLWNSLHDKPGERWEDNPWVVAVTFDVRQGNIDRIER